MEGKVPIPKQMRDNINVGLGFDKFSVTNIYNTSAIVWIRDMRTKNIKNRWTQIEIMQKHMMPTFLWIKMFNLFKSSYEPAEWELTYDSGPDVEYFFVYSSSDEENLDIFLSI